MGQAKVLDVLKKNSKPMSAQEIAEELKEENIKKIFVLLNKLLKCNEIYCIEIDRWTAMELYNSKRRMRLYLTL